MKNLILLRGLPGSGKSSLAEMFNQLPNSRSVAADDYFTDSISGSYDFILSQLHQSHVWCREQCESFMKEDVETIIVHNTFSTESEMEKFLEMGAAYGYIIRTIIVENRHGGKSVHCVDEATMERFRNRFAIKL